MFPFLAGLVRRVEVLAELHRGGVLAEVVEGVVQGVREARPRGAGSGAGGRLRSSL